MKIQKDRHTVLMFAGWIYDARTDRYRAPESDPRTATWYNLDAAYGAYCATQQTKLPDPRRQTPL